MAQHPNIPQISNVAVTPPASPEEVAAILAAIETVWPRPATVAEPVANKPGWRFSGRWWSRPSTARRDRPWVER